MTATEELRHMLDERGVEWNSSDTYRLFVTSWDDANDHRWAYVEYRDGSFERLTAYHLTPEQAIDATLGRRTTTRHVPYCGCCGYGIGDARWHYCPSCGAKVVDA